MVSTREPLLINKYCRLCLKEDTWDMPLPLCRDSIRSTIKSVLGIEVEVGERLPNSICHRCLSNLDFFSNFKKQVDTSTSWLRDFGLIEAEPADTAKPVNTAKRRRIGPKSRVPGPIEEANNEVAAGSKNRATRSCPSCDFKTGNPVDYRKHREEHRNKSENENTERDNTSAPSEDNDEERDNGEKQEDNNEWNANVTYFPCLECDTYLISSRQKLLEHRIEKHGYKVGGTGVEDSGEKVGDKTREADGGDKQNENIEPRESSGETVGNNESSKNYVNDCRISRNDEQKGRNGENGSIKMEVDSAQKNDDTTGETSKSVTKAPSVVSVYTTEEELPMPKLKAKKQLSSKEGSARRTLSRSKSRDLDEVDSSTDSDTSSQGVNIRRRKKFKSAQFVSTDESDDARDKVPNQGDKEEHEGSEKNRESDEEILSMINHQMETLINSCKKADAESGETAEKLVDKTAEDKQLLDRGEMPKKQLTNKREVLCDLCNKFFPSLSILASHKRRSHQQPSTDKKTEEKPPGHVRASTSDGGDVKRLPYGGRIVKRSQNVGSKKPGDESGDNRSQNDDSNTPHNSAKRPRKESSEHNGLRVSNIKPQDSLRPLKDGSTPTKPQDGDTTTVNRQQDASSSAKWPEDGRDSGGQKEMDFKLPCCICDKLFATASELESHRRERHKCKESPTPLPNKVPCNLCDEMFPTIGALLNHKYDHHKKGSTKR
ncbi:uncharacterized protein LOC111053611 isoform X2 [Nilaparvata lugens]|nr:uncharacterized protein LOC111053611 isoform X2 [Nilaparvata lugens]